MSRSLPPGPGLPTVHGGGLDPDEQGVRPMSVYLRFLTGLIRRHLLLILGVTAATVGGVAWYLWSKPPRFAAFAVVRIDDARGALTAGIDRGAGNVAGNGGEALQTQIEILRSRRVIGRAVDSSGVRIQPRDNRDLESVLERIHVDPATSLETLSLAFGPDQFALRSERSAGIVAYGDTASVEGVRFIIHEPPGMNRAVLDIISRDAAIGRVTGRTSVQPRRQTEILDVRFESDSPRDAMIMVNHVVAAFRAVDVETAQQQARRRREFLERQVAANDSLLHDAQLELSRFRLNNRLDTQEGRIAARQTALVDVELRQHELEGQRRSYRSLLDEVRTAGEGNRSGRLQVLMASPGIASSPVIGHLYTQLLRYQTARDTLTGSGAPASHPDVIQMDRMIDSVEESLIEAIESHITALDSQIATLAAMRESTAGELAASALPPQAEVTAIQLEEQVETIRQMADLVRVEYQRARIEEAVEAGHVEIVDLATRFGAPVDSGRYQQLIVAAILGLMMSGGLAYVRESLDTSIHVGDDLEAAVPLPTLATVPRLLPDSPRGWLGRGGRTDRSETLEGRTGRYERRLEAFRMLGASLAYSANGHGNGESQRVVLVTSSAPGEGKSTTAVNLAMAQAEAGNRVLLIDCDVIRPVVHKIFRIGQSPGLVQVLHGQVDIDDALRSTRFGFQVLPAGGIEAGSGLTLNRLQMLDLLDGLRDSYDRIILDAPPVLLMANAVVLATVADAVVLVVRSGKTDRGAAMQAVNRLRMVGAPLVGTVVNDPDNEMARYADSYYTGSYFVDE